jgi:hypothetical protein
MRKGIGLVLMLICGVVFAQQTENFSGHWVLAKTMPINTVKVPGSFTLDIMQSGNEFAVTQTAALDGEKTTEESKYTLDGTENVNIKSNEPGPPTTIRSTSSWNNGILTLQGSSTSVGPEGDVVRPWKREYFRSADHTVLSVRETIPTPFGDAVVSQVYGK